MKRLSVVLSLAVVSACSKTPDSALAVRVRASTALKADCVELAISSGGSQKKSLVLDRAAMKEEWVIGVRRGDDLPDTITLQARAYLGTCGDPASLKINSRSAEVQATFPKEGVEAVQPLQLDPPDATLDGDRDGFVAVAQGGADCDDTLASTFPGSVQLCTTEADTDCDGVVACADSDCTSSSECLEPPDRLRLENVPLMLQRTQCSPAITVELRNALGPRAAGLTTAVALSGDLAGLAFYGDAACTVPVAGATIPFQQSSATVYLRGDTAGLAKVTATSGALTPASVDLVITPVPPTQLVFTSPPRTLAAGSCVNNEATVQLVDAQGRPTTVTSDLNVALFATPNDLLNGNFSVGTTCAAPGVSGVVIPAGQGQATFRVFSRQASDAGMPMRIEASVDVGLPMRLIATQDVTITPGAPDQLSFGPGMLAISSTEACSSVRMARLRIQVQDQFGNRAPPVVPATLVLSGPAGLTFHDAATGNCDTPITTTVLPAGTAEQEFFLKSTTPGTGMVRITDMAGVLKPAQQAVTVSAGAPTKFRWDNNPRTTDARLCTSQPVTLRAYDSGDAPASFATNVQVALSTLTAVPGLSFYTAPGCTMASRLTGNATFPSGMTALPLYFQGSTAVSNFTIRATPVGVSGVTGDDLPGNTIRPGPPASLRFSPTSQTVQAGQCAGPFTVSVLDADNNAASFTSAVDLTFSTTLGTFTWGTSSTSCAGTSPVPLAVGQTSAQVWLTSTTSRATPYAVSASAGGVNSSNQAAVTVTPGPSTGLSVFEPSSTTQTLEAGSCLLVTLERKDTYGNDVPVGAASTLTFPTVPMGVTFHATLAQCQGDTNAVGSFALAATESRRSFYVRVERTVSAAALTASLLGQTANLTLTVTPAPTASVTFVGLPASRQSGVCSGPLSLARRDAFGNDATADGALGATITATGVTFYSSTDCTGGTTPSPALTFAANQATSTGFSMSATTTGSYPVTASAGGFSDMKTFSVTPGAAARVVLSPSGGAVTADDCTNLTATVVDANSNPVPGTYVVGLAASPMLGVTFYNQNNCAGGMTTQRSTLGAASATFSFRATAPQATLTITASVSGLMDGQNTYSVTVGAATKVVLPTLGATVAAGDCVDATAEVQDFWNNPVAGSRDLGFTANPVAGVLFYAGAGCLGTDVPSVNTAGGTGISFSFRPTRTQANQVITVSSAGLTGASRTWNVTAGAATRVAITTMGRSINAGTCEAVQAQVQDAYDNPVTGARTIDYAASPSTGVTFYTNTDCSGLGTSESTGAGSTVNFSFRANVPAAPLTVSAASTGLTTGTRDWTITLGPPAKLAWKTGEAPPATLARFVCGGPYTAQLQDAADNVVTVSGADRAVTFSAPGGNAGLTFFSDASCTTVATGATMAIGTSEVGFYLLGTGGTTASTVTAASTGVTSATQGVGMTGAQGALVATVTPTDLEAGGCEAVTVERRDAAAAAFSKGVTPVSLASNNAGVTLHTAMDCSGAGSGTLALSILDGMSAITAYARGRSVASAVAVSLTPTDPNGGSTSTADSVTTHPLVRRGTCNLANNSASNTCAVGLPGTDISRTFLVFQATGDQNTPDDANVECHLAASTQVDVVCTRNNNPNNPVAIAWQTVSWGRSAANGGLTVQHFSGSAPTMTATHDLTIASVDMTRSFVLFSSRSSAGASANDNDTEDLYVAKLTSPTNVRLQGTVNFPTSTYSVQVVELAGARVDRGTLTVPVNSYSASGVTVLASPVATRMSPLFTARTADTGTAQRLCKRRLRGLVTNTSGASLVVERGGSLTTGMSVCNESAVDELAWELIEWPVNTAVARPPVGTPLSMAAGTSTATWSGASLPVFAQHRTLLYLAGQGPGGQSSGEGQHNDDRLGEFSARLEFSGANVLLTRGDTSDIAVFTPYGVEFAP